MDGHRTEDSLFGGRLVCRQHRGGYRFSVDSVLLAHFPDPARGAKILDLGSGCGIISLVLAYRHPTVALLAVEIQPQLAALARENVAANGLAERVAVRCQDFRETPPPYEAGSFDLVVCNPPFYRIGSGRRNPGDEQALARHEVNADLEAVVRAAAYGLKTRGRFACVYPAARAATLLYELKRQKLEPKRLQVVHSYPGDCGRLVLVEAVRFGGEQLVVLPPFFVYTEPNGPFSPEMSRCYQP